MFGKIITPPKDLKWHDSDKRYKVAITNTKYISEYKSKSNVYIYDKKTGKTIKRVGYGEQMGNFHPIWVSLKGKKIQLTELLREI